MSKKLDDELYAYFNSEIEKQSKRPFERALSQSLDNSYKKKVVPAPHHFTKCACAIAACLFILGGIQYKHAEKSLGTVINQNFVNEQAIDEWQLSFFEICQLYQGSALK